MSRYLSFCMNIKLFLQEQIRRIFVRTILGLSNGSRIIKAAKNGIDYRYPSCFNANTGIFEQIYTIDSVNHASIIDGIRLSKGQRYRYDKQ